jgi:transposase InsO family protein
LWVADFTYLRCWEGLVFFSFVLDAHSRRVVGWQFATSMRTDLVLDALRMALTRREHGADLELVHHSDAGSQYTSFAFQQALDDHRVLQSIGSVGDAYDNAVAESFVDTFKTELIADRVWRTRSQLELAIVEWVAWFNTSRLHASSAMFHPPSSRISTLDRVTISPPLDEERKPPNPVSARPSPPHSPLDRDQWAKAAANLLRSPDRRPTPDIDIARALEPTFDLGL